MYSKCFVLLFLLTGVIDAYTNMRCLQPHLENGRVRLRQRSKLVKFICLLPYDLVGNRYATCRNGHWDTPIPICVRGGCPPLQAPANAIHLKSHHDAWVVTFCLPGFKIVGPDAIYCDGYRWNASAPRCIDSTIESTLSCDFENANLCGWMQDEKHDFDWKRINTETPSSAYINTGPSFDHTYGRGKSGYYMYIESTSRMMNDTARLLSPIYEKHLAINGCFSFFYHMFGLHTGGLKVYQKPDRLDLYDMLKLPIGERQQYLLFEQWGNLGDQWFGHVSPLKNFNDGFQIVIEGIRGASFSSDIAIDDVAILQGSNCTVALEALTTVATPVLESCVGRCDLGGVNPVLGCGCSLSCVGDSDCCPDFLETCVFDNNTNVTDGDDDGASSAEQPQTEKLIGTPTTASTAQPTTTVQTTTTTPQPTTTSTTRPSTTTSKPTTRSTSTTTTTARPTTRTTTTQRTTQSTTTQSTTFQPTTTTRTTAKAVTSSAVTTPKVATTTQLSTTRITTTRSTTTKRDFDEEEKEKREQEDALQKMDGANDKLVKSQSRPWVSATVTIIVLAAVSGLIYFAVIARGARGRAAFARLRGRVASDPDVQFLNSTDDL